MNRWRYSFFAGALVAGAGMAALLLGLPGVQAEGAPGAVAVHATDYAYQGVPGTLPAGETRFSFTNDSKAESHELSLFRINDGVKRVVRPDPGRRRSPAEPAGPAGWPGRPAG